MFKKATKQQRMKLLGSLVSSILLGGLALTVITIFINKSFGWFSSNRIVDSTGMQVQMKGMDAEAEYTVYIFDAKENGVRYTNDGQDNDPKLEDLKMQIHDAIFKSRNRYTPAVIHIRLYNIKDTYLNGGNVSITLTRNTSIPESIDGNLSENSTSVLRFTLVNNSGDSWISTAGTSNENAQQTFNNVDTALYSKIVTNKNYEDTGTLDIDSKIFTTIDPNISKSDYITLSVEYSASDVSDGELDLFLYITYDETLVTRFENGTGISGTSVGQITTLTNDLTTFVVSFGTN